MEEMEGVTNTIKEFSDSFDDLYNTWKYVVEQDDVGVNIKYMEKMHGKWEVINSMNINFLCAEKLFINVSEAFEYGEFTDKF